MPQKYGHLANAVPEAQSFTCLVCGASPARWTWSDQHGEAMCIQCGTPYQLLHYEGKKDSRKRIEGPPKIKVKKSWLPILKQYWEETRQFMGLGTIMIARDYPECVRGQELFYDWLDQHPGLIPEEDEERGNKKGEANG